MMPERQQLRLLTAALGNANVSWYVGPVDKKATRKLSVPTKQQHMGEDVVAVKMQDALPHLKARGKAKAQPRAAARARAKASPIDNLL